VNLPDILSLEHHGPDTWMGRGPRYPWGGLYGGQIVAQALKAAAHTVPDRYKVNSLHAYFIRGGDQDAPVRYEVDRLRDGRSFATRAVVARQAVGAILNLSASFHAEEHETDEADVPMPAVPRPDTLADDTWSKAFDRRLVPSDEIGRESAWARASSALPDRHIDHAAAVAYLSDDFPTGAAVRLHPFARSHGGWQDGMFMTASLDHSIWFHRELAADGWHLHDVVCHQLRGARALTRGRVYDQAGNLCATFAQEVLLRVSRTWLDRREPPDEMA